MKTCVVFNSYIYNSEILYRYQKLKNACESFNYDIKWATSNNNIINEHKNNIDFISLQDLKNQYQYKYSYLYKMPEYEYFRMNGITLTLLYFIDNEKQYDYIWHIEYDLIYSGNITDVFKLFDQNNSDFITSLIKKKSEFEYWGWWQNVVDKSFSMFQYDKLYKSFNPITRYSKTALISIKQFYEKYNINNDMFFEWAYISSIIHNKLTYIDICKYMKTYFSVCQLNINSIEKNILYHAVKDNVNLSTI